MSSGLSELIDKFESLVSTRTTAMELVQRLKGQNGAMFDLSQRAPGTEKTLAEIDARVISICGLGRSIDPAAELVLVPQAVLDDVSKHIVSIQSQYQSVLDQLARTSTADDGSGTLDPVALTFVSPDGKVNVQLGAVFDTIWRTSEVLLLPLHRLLAIVGVAGHTDFSVAASAFTKVVASIHTQRNELFHLIEKTTANQKQLEGLLTNASSAQSEIERLKSESDKDRKSLAEYESEGTQKATAIRAISEQAEQLKKTVKAYQATFENFQAKLDAREQSIAEGNQEQEALIGNCKEIKKNIVALNQQAEDMLSGATVAGLASAYGSMRQDLSGELRRARLAFYVSIAFLGASVIPLAMYVIPGVSALFPEQVATASTETGPADLLLQILARAILLIPAAWLTKFAASRHASLFRLKEHYAYKYSVASSVEGFKKQAEPYSDEIAAATFFELTDNPAIGMESQNHEERHPNPAMEWLMKRVGATHDGK